MDFFGIGLPEIIFILLIAFVLFGPKRIVEISRTAGNVMRNLSKDASDIQEKLNEELEGEKPGGHGTVDRRSDQAKP
ncbi:MAG: twin-arginine translocase TatA/TatE family subunit [Dehalococcoidia bacterium]|nr:twin-arginine translocase TatA/TatE family subunit [Dehalococcoidia bacterium]MDD5648394.1 twin-arginine translocase TatA/TatE family subunit [Dehalococcoidia bacterium]